MRIKSYIIIILILVVLLIVLVSAMFWLDNPPNINEVPASPSPVEDPETAGWSAYESREWNFKIQYPEYLSLSEDAAYYDLAGVYEKSEPAAGAVPVGIVRLSGTVNGVWNDYAIYAIHPQDMGAAADEAAAFIREFENNFPEYKEPGEKAVSSESVKIADYDFQKRISEFSSGGTAVQRITYFLNQSPEALFVMSSKSGGLDRAELMQKMLATLGAKQ